MSGINQKFNGIFYPPIGSGNHMTDFVTMESGMDNIKVASIMTALASALVPVHFLLSLSPMSRPPAIPCGKTNHG